MERTNNAMDATANSELATDTLADNSGMFGHPRGLSMLFFTEFWERFSYYGMRSILVLYMTATVAEGGLGFDVKAAATLYGSYTMWVYLTGLPGGLTADRLLGARLAVLLGGVVIICGHVAMRRSCGASTSRKTVRRCELILSKRTR